MHNECVLSGIIRSCGTAVNGFKAVAERADWARKLVIARRLVFNYTSFIALIHTHTQLYIFHILMLINPLRMLFALSVYIRIFEQLRPADNQTTASFFDIHLIETEPIQLNPLHDDAKFNIPQTGIIPMLKKLFKIVFQEIPSTFRFLFSKHDSDSGVSTSKKKSLLFRNIANKNGEGI